MLDKQIVGLERIGRDDIVVEEMIEQKEDCNALEVDQRNEIDCMLVADMRKELVVVMQRDAIIVQDELVIVLDKLVVD